MIGMHDKSLLVEEPGNVVPQPTFRVPGTPEDPAILPSFEFAARGVAQEVDAALPTHSSSALCDAPPALPPRPLKTPERPVSLEEFSLASGLELVPAEGNCSPWYQAAKRTVDVVGAAVLLVLLSPVLLAVWVVLMFSGGKPIFRQIRLGYRGRPFVMYKFRSMLPDAERRKHEVANEQDGPIFKNRRDPRITRVGRFLRAMSIDELPQLFNVLAGHMSLVGPRPPLPKEVAQYEPWQRRRLAVKPGLTCLWQVSGRSEVSFQEWVRMDLWYIEHQSLLVDLKLLWKTPWSVLSGRGAY